jgi:hypothetical protein
MLTILAVVTALTGCNRDIHGTATPGSRDVDPAYFFAGEVPTYGRSVSPAEATTMMYLRAMRRIDPCGLLNRQALAKIGEINSVGTLFALDECDLDIKVPGKADRRYASVGIVLSQMWRAPVAFRVGEVPVYESYPGSCQYLMPLDLARLPGARPLPKPDQPFVRIGLIAQKDCDFTQRLVDAVAPRIAALQLPVRDAVATYPAALAEHDPCQVLSTLGSQVARWDIDRSQPYECDFTLAAKDFRGPVGMRVTLKPQLYDTASDRRLHFVRDGVEMMVDESFCSTVAFVGAAMQRKLFGGDFVDTGSVIIRPSIVVENGGGRCDAGTKVATTAAKLYS